MGMPSLVVSSVPPRDMRLLLDGLAARFGGNARAVVEVAAALLRRSDVDDVCVIAGESSIVAGEARRRGLRLVAPSPLLTAKLPLRLGWTALRLPAMAEKLEADALLSFSGILPRHPSRPVISLVSSSVPFEAGASRRNLRRLAIARTVRRSSVVYVPSRHMYDLLGVPNAKVVSWGVDRQVFRPNSHVGTEVLSVADFYPHKRHDLVLEAWLRLTKPRPVLRVVGDPAVDRKSFATFAQKTRSHHGVIVEGPLPYSWMAGRYHAARTIVLASESESFCMPLAEAMACGVPAVARDHPALQETGGAGATYIDGFDPEDWARAIEAAYDDAHHTSMRTAAVEEAKRFSWDDFAATIVGDCRRIHAASRGDEAAGFAP
jgi:glycosyltransferase involved in cell wall biosynthesis